MRVLHIVPKLFGSDDGIVGGAERYAHELARHMAREVSTTLLSFGEEDRDEEIDRLCIRVLGRSWQVKGQATNPFSLKLLPVVLEADIVHCHQTHVLASSVAALVCRMTSRRVFTTDLGGGGWDFSGYLNTDSWYHGHLHISEYSKQIAAHERNGRAHVILGGVDAEKFSPGLSQNQAFKVLFVGRVLPHKGLDDLITALPEGVGLTIVGRHYNDKFASDLRILARNKNVTFRSECDDAGLLEEYRSANCVVLPSVYCDRYGNETRIPELLGQTLLEGMACGLPAICTEVASLPEIVRDKVTGFIVPPNCASALKAKIEWLVAHPVEAVAMGELGRLRARSHFSWDSVVQRCLDLYER